MSSHTFCHPLNPMCRHPLLQTAAILISLSLFICMALGSVVAFGSEVPADVLESFNER